MLLPDTLIDPVFCLLVNFNFFIMKTNYFRNVIAILAILFAIGAPFILRASEKNINFIELGYYNPIAGNPSPCFLAVQCSTSGWTVCTASYAGNTYQAFGKPYFADTICSIFLYRL